MRAIGVFDAGRYRVPVQRSSWRPAPRRVLAQSPSGLQTVQQLGGEKRMATTTSVQRGAESIMRNHLPQTPRLLAGDCASQPLCLDITGQSTQDLAKNLVGVATSRMHAETPP